LVYGWPYECLLDKALERLQGEIADADAPTGELIRIYDTAEMRDGQTYFANPSFLMISNSFHTASTSGTARGLWMRYRSTYSRPSCRRLTVCKCLESQEKDTHVGQTAPDCFLDVPEPVFCGNI
jgi:hypothetical protein